MGGSATTSLLAELRQRGIVIVSKGSQVRVKPKDAITPELRESLKAQKAPLLAALTLESRVLGMPLSRFEREGRSIQIKLPRLPETIWFVPGEADIERLARRDIARGRIWTAKELRLLWEGGPEARGSATTLARIKLDLDGELVSVEHLRDPGRPEDSAE